MRNGSECSLANYDMARPLADVFECPFSVTSHQDGITVFCLSRDNDFDVTREPDTSGKFKWTVRYRDVEIATARSLQNLAANNHLRRQLRGLEQPMTLSSESRLERKQIIGRRAFTRIISERNLLASHTTVAS